MQYQHHNGLMIQQHMKEPVSMILQHLKVINKSYLKELIYFQILLLALTKFLLIMVFILLYCQTFNTKSYIVNLNLKLSIPRLISVYFGILEKLSVTQSKKHLNQSIWIYCFPTKMYISKSLFLTML